MTTKWEITTALKCAAAARVEGKIKVAEAWEAIAEALRLGTMSIDEALARAARAIDRGDLEEANACGFIGRTLSQGKPRIAEAWERIAKAQTVLEAIEAKAQLAANLAWGEGKVEEAVAWEEAAKGWFYGDSVAGEVWERAAAAGGADSEITTALKRAIAARTDGKIKAAEAWEAIAAALRLGTMSIHEAVVHVTNSMGYDALAYQAWIEGSDEEADAWERAETARITGDADAAEAWACVARVRGGDISRAEVASVWTKASQTWAKTIAAELMCAAESLRAVSPSAFCTAEALEAWEHALEARDDGKVAVATAWARAAAAWVLSNCRREEDAKAWEQVAKALTNDDAELAAVWERTAKALAGENNEAAIAWEEIDRGTYE